MSDTDSKGSEEDSELLFEDDFVVTADASRTVKQSLLFSFGFA